MRMSRAGAFFFANTAGAMAPPLRFICGPVLRRVCPRDTRMTVYPDATTGRMEGCHHSGKYPRRAELSSLLDEVQNDAMRSAQVYERAVPRLARDVPDVGTNVLS